MDGADGVDGARRWRLSGFGVVTFWLPIAGLLAIVTLGVVAAAPAEDVPLGFLVVWLGGAVFVGSQLLRQATGVEIDAAGTVRLYRPLLPDVAVPIGRVRRLGLGPIARKVRVGVGNSPRVIEHDADGRIRRVPLASGLTGLFDLGAALREGNPDVEVDLG